MIASIFKRQMKLAMALCAGGMMVTGASPAMANSAAATATVAPTQAAPSVIDNTAQSVSIDDGDRQFRQLFASWKSLDDGAKGGSGVATTPTTSVSVPSRMPLGGSHLTSGYGMRTHPVTGGRRRHKGIDLAAPTGTPVYATADGTVTKSQRFSSYGLYISISHGGSLETRYAHMSRLAVPAGATVRKGDVIGYVGSTGRSTGPHLHYEVRVDGRAVNPMPYMAETRAQEAFAEANQGGRGGS